MLRTGSHRLSRSTLRRLPAAALRHGARLAALGLCVAVTLDQVQARQVKRQAYLMGTLCTISAESDNRRQGLAQIETGFAAIRQAEDLLSTWRTDTPLAALADRQPGTAVNVPAELARILAAARGLWGQTLGAFDPAIGSLVDAWDLRGEGRTPSAGDLADAVARSGMQYVVVDPARNTVKMLVPGLSFDAGAFGKGEGLNQAARALDEAGLISWRIHFGGQVMLSAAGGRRQVDVAHPVRRGRVIARLGLEGGTVATSSQSERPGHILDPRSGRPAADIGSVTVVGKDALAVDALATGLYVLGPGQGLQLAAYLDDIEVMYIVRRGENWVAQVTPGFKGVLDETDIPVEVPDTRQSNVRGAMLPDTLFHSPTAGPDHDPVDALAVCRRSGEFPS